MKQLLAQQWASFRERVVPADAGPLQVQGMRRAFYGGAEALLRSIMKDLDPGLEPTEADMVRMADIETELAQFARDVFGGRA